MKTWEQYLDSPQLVGARCVHCNARVGREHARREDATFGWTVQGCSLLQWLYVVCPDCGRQTSFDQLLITMTHPNPRTNAA